jgi:GNAT superfamily N-acetyltransferase
MKSLRKIIRENIEYVMSKNNNHPVLFVDIDGSQDILLDGEKIGEVALSNRHNKYLVLDKIFIEKEHQSKGYGQKVMEQIIDFANKDSLIITLTPDDVWGSKKKRLTDWYKSLGFIMNKGKKKDFETMQLMYKLPDTMDEVSNWPQSNMRNFIPPQYPAFPNPADYDEFGNLISDMSR